VKRAGLRPAAFATGLVLAVLGVGAAPGVYTAFGAGPAFAAGASPVPVSDCTATTGATLVVDFAYWGGPLLRACGSTPTTGFALLNQGGWHTSGTVHDGPGFVCRIGYAGFRSGTQYPTPATQACVNTPPASAYWSFWEAGPGQDAWTYSQAGALNYRPAPGSISLWIFGGTSISGSFGSARPTFSPGQVRGGTSALTAADHGRLALVNARPLSASQPGSAGSDRSVLVTALIVLALTGAGFAAAWRRRRSSRAA
jgi:hypothetical protein